MDLNLSSDSITSQFSVDFVTSESDSNQSVFSVEFVKGEDSKVLSEESCKLFHQ